MLALIPGPDTFLVLRISMSRAKAGITAAAGSATGALAWAALVGFGLAAIVEQSAAPRAEPRPPLERDTVAGQDPAHDALRAGARLPEN